MIRRQVLWVSIVVGCTAFLPVAKGAILSFEANLDGLQEVPPNASPAFGFAAATLDDATGQFTITTGTYQDLLGGATAIVLGDAPPGVGGPTIFALTLDTPGAATGTFSGGGVITPAQVTDMIAGNTFLNLRSQVFPSGEIRGQLFQVPEPASAMLLVVGGLVLACMIPAGRRRRAV